MLTKQRKTFYEMLDEVDRQTSKKKRIEVLHSYSSPNLKRILDSCFNPNVTWLLPEGAPPYKPCPDDPGSLVLRLVQDIRKLDIFTNSGKYPNLKAKIREQIFIEFIESLHPTDAKLLLAIKDKQMPFQNVTKELVAEAFPILASKWEVKK